MDLVVLTESYERPDVCAPCGGKCCKSMPGAALPSDFGATPEEILPKLAARLATGLWAIDWWEGDPRLDGEDSDGRSYFVRPAVAGVSDLFDPSWGGRCTFHSSRGCEIFAERPSGCRGLEPSDNPVKDGCHVRHSDKRAAAIAWLPFHAVILQAAEGRQ